MHNGHIAECIQIQEDSQVNYDFLPTNNCMHAYTAKMDFKANPKYNFKNSTAF